MQAIKAIDECHGKGGVERVRIDNIDNKAIATVYDKRMPYVEMLGRIGPDARDALPVLNEIAMGKGNPSLTAAARQAISKIQGEKK